MLTIHKGGYLMQIFEIGFLVSYGLMIFVFMLVLLFGILKRGFIGDEDGFHAKDFVLLIISVTMFLMIISNIWLWQQTLAIVEEMDRTTVVIELLKQALYVNAFFVIPYGIVVTFYFLKDENTKNIKKIIKAIGGIRNKNVIPTKPPEFDYGSTDLGLDTEEKEEETH
jgi:hypothetical protein